MNQPPVPAPAGEAGPAVVVVGGGGGNADAVGSLLAHPPVAALLARVARELPAEFEAARPVRVARAPGRLDVMGGIADYTGSLVCEATLDRAVAVAAQRRADRQLQVVSFNFLDENRPFTFRMPLDALAGATFETLRRDFAEPGRHWAAYVVGCLFVLHREKLVDLSDAQRVPGLNVAVLSTVPIGGGVSSSAALEVASMVAFRDELGVAAGLDPMRLAELCQAAENRIAGAPCGIMDQVTACVGEPGTLLRLVCQPHELLPPLRLPEGVRVVGLNSGVRHSVGGAAYTRTRVAAFMGHAIILDRMKRMGQAAGQAMTGDPMRGYLANLALDDYKMYFRPYVPEMMKGLEFLEAYGPTIDPVTAVHPDHEYPVQHATDHHVWEAHRVKNFVAFLEEAAALAPGGGADDEARRKLLLNKAGHLMYASHMSYNNEAMLGAPECDLLVELVKAREPQGLYGAKITGGGSGGTVAVLADVSARADAALAEIQAEYQRQTGRAAELLAGTSPGAWYTGSAVVTDWNYR